MTSINRFNTFNHFQFNKSSGGCSHFESSSVIHQPNNRLQHQPTGHHQHSMNHSFNEFDKKSLNSQAESGASLHPVKCTLVRDLPQFRNRNSQIKKYLANYENALTNYNQFTSLNTSGADVDNSCLPTADDDTDCVEKSEAEVKITGMSPPRSVRIMYDQTKPTSSNPSSVSYESTSIKISAPSSSKVAETSSQSRAHVIDRYAPAFSNYKAHPLDHDANLNFDSPSSFRNEDARRSLIDSNSRSKLHFAEKNDHAASTSLNDASNRASMAESSYTMINDRKMEAMIDKILVKVNDHTSKLEADISSLSNRLTSELEKQQQQTSNAQTQQNGVVDQMASFIEELKDFIEDRLIDTTCQLELSNQRTSDLFMSLNMLIGEIAFLKYQNYELKNNLNSFIQNYIIDQRRQEELLGKVHHRVAVIDKKLGGGGKSEGSKRKRKFKNKSNGNSYRPSTSCTSESNSNSESFDSKANEMAAASARGHEPNSLISTGTCIDVMDLNDDIKLNYYGSEVLYSAMDELMQQSSPKAHTMNGKVVEKKKITKQKSMENLYVPDRPKYDIDEEEEERSNESNSKEERLEDSQGNELNKLNERTYSDKSGTFSEFGDASRSHSYQE